MPSELVRRILLILTFALWFGGFTFYAEVVIPTAHGLFHSEMKVGFLTERVTTWLNLISIPSIATMVWHFVASRKTEEKRLRTRLMISLALIILCACLLFAIHPLMDAQLNREANEILNERYFHILHGSYETIATVQWLAGILHLWWCVLLWHKKDSGQSQAVRTTTFA